jgi:predicted nucleic acid-binding Zn ribbon protein
MQCHGRNTSEHIVKASKDKALPVLTKKCIVCGKEFETKLTKRIACSHKCGAIHNHSVRTDEQKEAMNSKRKKTCLEKYGDEHVVNSRYTREKTKEKLGVEYPWQSSTVLNNIRERYYDKHGVYYPWAITSTTRLAALAAA